MIKISQDDDTGCGIACFAMLFQRSYNDSKKLLFPIPPSNNKFNTKHKLIINKIDEIGIKTNRKISKYTDYKKSIHDCLIYGRINISGTEYYHWVVWDSKEKKILDPCRATNIRGFKPISFYEILRT